MMSARVTLLAPLWILLHVLPACIVLGADGNWGEWTEWESCPVTCGQGTRRRFRYCNNPPPTNRGQWCSGKSRETSNCNAAVDCPVDGHWSDWSPWSLCSVSCGEGIQSRFRDCDSPAPAKGGRDCEGSSQESKECGSAKDCPRDGQWSKWSSWSACSVTCGDDGSSFRYRSCNNPPPRGGGKECEGRTQQNRRCRAAVKCAVNGQWTEWSEWSSCSVTCGSGVRNRWRRCDNPPPQNGGMDCSRDDAGEIQERSCNGSVVFCPVNGGWSEWSEFGECHTPDCRAKKNKKLYQFQHRTCSSPYPAHKGSMCQGPFLRAALCKDPEIPVNCAVDGKWSEWSGWDCTPFVGIRTRKCNNPPPSNGGKRCKGKELDKVCLEDERFREFCPDVVEGSAAGPDDEEDMDGCENDPGEDYDEEMED